MITHRCACQKSYTSIIITSITWAGPRCVQEAAAILGPQNRTQGRCVTVSPSTSKCCKYDKGCCSVPSTLQPAAGRESAAEPDPDEWSLGAGGTNSDVSEGRGGEQAPVTAVSCHVITQPPAVHWWLRDHGTRDSAGPSSILSLPSH